MVKNPPARQEVLVQSLGQKDPLEKEMATHSSILAWRIPRTEKPGDRVRQSQAVNYLYCIHLGLSVLLFLSVQMSGLLSNEPIYSV